MKKKKKKLKLKIIPVILLILIVFFLVFLASLFLKIKIKNIYIMGNKYLNDEYIIEKADLKDYPPIAKNLAFQVAKRLKNDFFIKDAKVNYSFFGVININITENRLLFFYEHNKKYVFETKVEVENIPYERVVTNLINFVPDIVYEKLIEKYNIITEDITNKISQIKYDPSDYDKERFLFYMNDGNYVYITLNKIDSMNYYNEIYKTLNNKKGILYLDSGNHFQEIK